MSVKVCCGECGTKTEVVENFKCPVCASNSGSANTPPNNAMGEIAATVADLVAYLDGGASVRPEDDWHKRLRQLSPVA